MHHNLVYNVDIVQLKQMNTKKQGDIGLGDAICYFTGLGLTVCVPLTDSQEYDLIVHNRFSLSRVQVKRTTYKRKGKYQVSLTVKGGNRTSKGKVKGFDKSKVDIIVASTPEGLYVIPVCELNVKSLIALGNSYDRYRVK